MYATQSNEIKKLADSSTKTRHFKTNEQTEKQKEIDISRSHQNSIQVESKQQRNEESKRPIVRKRRINSIAKILEQVDSNKEKKMCLSHATNQIAIFKNPFEIKETLDSLKQRPPITEDNIKSREELREELEKFKHLINVRKVDSHAKDEYEREIIKLKWSKSCKENHY
jgi:hypothetical protein